MFDIFIAVDWTGAKAPKTKPLYTKSISVSVAEGQDVSLWQNDRHPKGLWSRTDFFESLSHLIKTTDKKIFIGFDAHFSFPEFMMDGTAQNMWQRVEDISKHQNDFYAGAFPITSPYADYYMRSKNDIGQKYKGIFRTCESYASTHKIAQPENIFKLIGPKQIGKAGLSSMRFLYALKQKLGDKIAIWPFEKTDGKQIVVGEIFSRIFIKNIGFGPKKLNTDNIHPALAKYNFTYKGAGDLNDHDTDALISAAGLSTLGKDILKIPNEIDPEIVQKEGWISGLFK